MFCRHIRKRYSDLKEYGCIVGGCMKDSHVLAPLAAFKPTRFPYYMQNIHIL